MTAPPQDDELTRIQRDSAYIDLQLKQRKLELKQRELDDKKRISRPALRAGMWIWGTVLTFLFAAILLSFWRASYHVDKEGVWRDDTFISGLYSVIKANPTVVAALVATLGVAWSWFFQMSFGKSTPPERKREHEPPGLELLREPPGPGAGV